MKNSGVLLGLLLVVAVALFLFGGRVREGLTNPGTILLSLNDWKTAGFCVNPNGATEMLVICNQSDPTSVQASKTKSSWSSNLKKAHDKLSGLLTQNGLNVSSNPFSGPGDITGDFVLNLLFYVWPYQATIPGMTSPPTQDTFSGDPQVSMFVNLPQGSQVQSALYQYFFGSATSSTKPATTSSKIQPATPTPSTQTCMPAVKQVPGGVSITQCFS